MPRPWSWLVLSLWGIGLIAGCGGKPTGLENLAPVKGKIVFQGQPITKGNVRSVALFPDKNQGNTTAHEPRGDIDADGHFEIVTANRKGRPRAITK